MAPAPGGRRVMTPAWRLPASSFTLERAAWLGWAAGMLCLLLWRLGAAPLFDVDEGAFAEATREMLVNRDFGHTTLNGVDRFDKPIFIYWLQAASVSLLGLSEFALRLPSALATWAWALAVVGFALPRFGWPAALAAGTVLVSSLGVLVIGRAATADACLNLWITLAALDLWRSVERHDPAARNRLWLWLGLGMLTKGPVALLVPIGGAVVWALASRRLSALKPALLHLPGWLLFLAVAGPWYAHALHRHGSAFVDGFFLRHNVGRFTAAMEGHGGFAGYQLVALPLLMLPWTPLLVPVAAQWRALWADALSRWLLCWAGFVLVFFSLAATRLPHYSLYGITPLALLAGRALVLASPRLQRALALSLGLMLLLTLFGPGLAQAWVATHGPASHRELLAGAPDGWAMWPAAALLALGAVALWRWRAPVAQRAGVAAVALAFAFTSLAVPWWGEALQGPVRRLADQARQHWGASGQGVLVQWDLHLPSVAVYLGQPVPRRVPAPGEWALVRSDRLPQPLPPGLKLWASERGLALVQRVETAP